MRLVDTPICLACPEINNLQHFFYECDYVRCFWENLFYWLNDRMKVNLNINAKYILFGIQEENDITFVSNFVILYAKQFIYRNRVNNIHSLSLVSFKSQLKQKLEIEKIITMNTKPVSFIKL